MIKGVPIVILLYTAWQVLFTALVSPLALGILTARQMGFTLEKATLGLAVGLVMAILLGYAAARTAIGLKMYTRGFRNIRSKEDFEETWKIQLYGSYDGVIAETHWSGAVLPLLIGIFSILGIFFPFNVALAVLTRWTLHVGVHAVLPRKASGETAVGTIGFVALGLLFMDIVSSFCFLLASNIVAPIIVHTLAAPISQLLGSKRRIADSLGISIE